MRINHNIPALNTYRMLNRNTSEVSRHLERLSSGLRINRAADDAAGLAVSEKMRSQIRGLAMAERNSLDGVSLIQTGEGALDTVHSLLQRMRELAVQAANGSNTEEDRNSIQAEINALTTEVNRIGNTLEFNTKKLLDGSASIKTITNVGALKDGRDSSVGSEANGSINIGTDKLDIIAQNKGTDLNGYKIDFGPDDNSAGQKAEVSGTVGSSTVTITSQNYGVDLNNYKIKFISGATGSQASASINGDTILVTRDWNLGVTTPATIESELEDAINTALTGKGLDSITLSSNPAITMPADIADFNNKTFTLTGGQDKVSASITGLTIRVTADWNNTGAAKPTLADIEAAINKVLKSENLGGITLGPTGTVFDISKFAGAGTVTLAGGVTSLDAKTATRTINISTTPHQDDVLTIDGRKIGFWDSTKDKYPDAAAAKTALGLGPQDAMIDIFDGEAYKSTTAIASNIVALSSQNGGNFYQNVKLQVSDSGSDIVISAKVAGAAGNAYQTSFAQSKESGLALQIGTHTGQKLIIDIPNMRAQAMNITGVTPGGTIVSRDGKIMAKLTTVKTVSDGVSDVLNEYALDVTTQENAGAAIKIYDEAINYVSEARAKLGAYQNRLEYTISNLGISNENLTAAESRIRDTDMAFEMTNYTKSNILNQAATAMLAQANQLPQGLLQLLQ